MEVERWRRLSELFEAVSGCRPEEQAALVDRLCGADAGLRSDLEELLAADLRSHSLLDAPWSEAGSQSGPEVSCPIREGDRIGAYRIGRQIGEGGMGVVFAADREDEHYSRRVAIKFLKGTPLGRHTAESFRNECRILARLEHPNVARLYDAGRTDDGVWYLVMERVEGVPLDRWVDTSDAPLEEILALVLQICSAVGFAHRNLIIHRDLKPSNVLVTPEGTVKLLDFGIARLIETPPGGEEQTTLFARPLTPQFASPEQLRGEPVNVLSDVYSLGVVLYRALTRRLPYSLDSVPRLIAFMNGDLAVPRPSSAVPPREARRLRGDLDAIALKAIEFEASRRYSSVEQLAADLRRHLAGQPVEAQVPSWRYRLGCLVRRNPATSAAVALLVVLILGFTAALARTAQQLAREQRRADAEATSARAVSDFLIELFGLTDPAETRGEAVRARDLLDRAAHQLRSEVHPPDIRAELADAVARAYSKLDLVDEALPLAETALALRTETFGARSAARAESLETLSRIAEQQSDFPRAESLARESLVLRREVLGADHPEVGDSLSRLATVVGLMGRAEEPEALFRQARDLYRRSLGFQALETAVATMDLGKTATDRGEHQRAIEHLREALAVLDVRQGIDHPHTLGARRYLARSLTELGELEEAERLSRQVLASARRVYGDAPHTEVAFSLDYLSQIVMRRGDLDDAERLRAEALEIRSALFDERSLPVSYSRVSLGRVLEEQGRLGEAERLYRRAIESLRSLGPGIENQLAYPLFFLGKVLVEQRRLAEARDLFLEVLAIFETRPPGERWRVAETQEALAGTLELQGRPEDALELRRLSHQGYREHLGEEDPRTRIAWSRLGELQASLGP
jgi:tetratricopeptide (TPR) repeat protein/predicted Ser/Thr protein kinase